MRIAIGGNGITGPGAAGLLDHWHQLTLYALNDYFAGHCNTRLVET